MAEIDLQMATLPPLVGLWVNWMMVVFMSSICFVRRHIEARWALASFICSMSLAILIFHLWGNIHLFGLAHLILWAPLFIYLLMRFKSDLEKKYKSWSLFKIWIIMLITTIGVSLPFDIRDIFLVIQGTKGMH